MKNANDFILGNYTDQATELELLEKDVFFKKIVLLLILAEELKTLNIILSLSLHDDYLKFDFYFKNEITGVVKEYTKYICEIEGVEQDFFDKHIKAFCVITSFENSFDNKNVKLQEMNGIFEKNSLISFNDGNGWIKLLCKLTDNENYYEYVLYNLLNKDLKLKNNVEKFIKI